jgi:hypothetical protein
LLSQHTQALGRLLKKTVISRQTEELLGEARARQRPQPGARTATKNDWLDLRHVKKPLTCLFCQPVERLDAGTRSLLLSSRTLAPPELTRPSNAAISEPFYYTNKKPIKPYDDGCLIKTIVNQYPKTVTDPIEWYVEFSKEFDETILLSRRNLKACVESLAYLNHFKFQGFISNRNYFWEETPNYKISEEYINDCNNLLKNYKENKEKSIYNSYGILISKFLENYRLYNKIVSEITYKKNSILVYQKFNKFYLNYYLINEKLIIIKIDYLKFILYPFRP